MQSGKMKSCKVMQSGAEMKSGIEMQRKAEKCKTVQK